MQIFISGSGKDGWLINSVSQRLRMLGAYPYWAAKDAPDKSVIRKIKNEIGESEAVFAFWTKNVEEDSNAMSFVIFESALAGERLYVFKDKGTKKNPPVIKDLVTWWDFDTADQNSLDALLERISDIVVNDLKCPRQRFGIILAAGKGTRMLPLLQKKHKSLLPVKGKSTILDQQIEALIDFGIHPTNIKIVIGYEMWSISHFLQKNIA